MIIKPNSIEKSTVSRAKNDLYRKFKDYFIRVTEKEFNTYGSYSVEGYISVNPMVEEKVFDTLMHNIDEIVPITGATGIGKTYLMLYCLKTYYEVDDIPTNTPVLYYKNGSYDLVYYSDFNITEPSILNDPSRLILAKIQAMYEYLLEQDFIKGAPDIEEYINKFKLEVKFYTDENKQFQEALYRLTSLLSTHESLIRNIIFVFDDLESLNEDKQFSLMANFLALFENLKSKSSGNYSSKFFFCLRNSTFYNIYKRDFYNTHRASKAAHILAAPSLSEIFERRFRIILSSITETETDASKKNEDTKKRNKSQQSKRNWAEARKILLSISNRVDKSYSNLLVKLNNNNVSKALDDFINILSNRRWTQKNVNPAASFVIKENDYYINDTNILRILSMDEQDVYYQNTHSSIRCILPKPGASKDDDFLAFLVLRAFRYRNECASGDISIRSQLIETNELIDAISSCLVRSSDDPTKRNNKHKQIAKSVNAAISYYVENRFVRKNIEPDTENDSKMYYMLPRGEQIFDLFFSQSILFSIFRDAFFWDNSKFDTKCSKYLLFENLVLEALKYCEQLLNTESVFFDKITENKAWNEYQTIWGRWSIAEKFYEGIAKSIQQFYKEDSPIPFDITEKMSEMENQIAALLSVFDAHYGENSLFD